MPVQETTKASLRICSAATVADVDVPEARRGPSIKLLPSMVPACVVSCGLIFGELEACALAVCWGYLRLGWQTSADSWDGGEIVAKGAGPKRCNAWPREAGKGATWTGNYCVDGEPRRRAG